MKMEHRIVAERSAKVGERSRTPPRGGEAPEATAVASRRDAVETPLDKVLSTAEWAGGRGKARWGILCGDARTVLTSMPDEWVDCVVTSPPYFWLRDYGVEGQMGLEPSVDEYVDNLCAVLDEVRRILRKDGLLFLNVGDTYYSGKGQSQGVDRKSAKRRFGLRAVDESGGMGIGLQRKSLIGIPWRLGIALSTRGWVLRSSIIWHRVNRLPEHVLDRPSRSYEYVFMLAKDRRYFFDREPLIEHEVEEDVWSIRARPKSAAGVDTASFPDELAKRCLDVGCREKGVVLDPFLGAGTTARVAIEMGRSAVGVDLNRDFCKYAAGQLESP